MKKDHYKQGLLPGDVRQDSRRKQMEAIKAGLRKKYKNLIRQAVTPEEKQALEVRRDAEIARQVEPFIREQKQDRPDCL